MLQEPFYPKSPCYLPKDLKADIENKSYDFDKELGALAKCWKILVRRVLVEIYGKQLANYCYKGNTGSRPGINPTIRTELYRKFTYLSTIFAIRISMYVSPVFYLQWLLTIFHSDSYSKCNG